MVPAGLLLEFSFLLLPPLLQFSVAALELLHLRLLVELDLWLHQVPGFRLQKTANADHGQGGTNA